MPSLDEKMSALAEQVLKRPLSDEEQLEIFRISDAMGMNNVQSFLYLLLVFKLHEDTMRRQFDKLAALEERIDATLRGSIEKILSDGAARIGADMGDTIAVRVEKMLVAVGEHHSLRGQTIVVCFFWVASTLAYWLGSGNVLRSVPSGGAMETLMFLPAGWCVFFCGVLYSLLWSCDHWRTIKRTARYRILLGVQIILLSSLVLALL